MADKSITKVSSLHAPSGHGGQKYLASGIHVSMRFWEREKPTEAKPKTSRDYETVGFVIVHLGEIFRTFFHPYVTGSAGTIAAAGVVEAHAAVQCDVED